MTSVHKTYPPEFKLEIARLVVDQGLRITNVMATSKVGRTAINRWVTQYRAEHASRAGMPSVKDGHPGA